MLNLIRLFMMTALLMSLESCSKITPDNFKKVHNGMTSAEVKDALGDPTEQELKAIAGLSGSTFIYRKDKIELKIVFLNDKVIAASSNFNN